MKRSRARLSAEERSHWAFAIQFNAYAEKHRCNFGHLCEAWRDFEAFHPGPHTLSDFALLYEAGCWEAN